MGKKPTEEQVRRLPKALLHDHLDGGLRPETIIEIAQEIGHQLPTYDPQELAEWFRSACDSGSLVRYLETFAHTVALQEISLGEPSFLPLFPPLLRFRPRREPLEQ